MSILVYLNDEVGDLMMVLSGLILVSRIGVVGWIKCSVKVFKKCLWDIMKGVGCLW